MTSSSPTRVLAEAVRGLPDGLAARPTTTEDLGAVADLLRACDLASCGHTSTNVEEVRAEVAGPDCGWAAGSATIWRGSQLVGVLNTFDQLADGGGWLIDAYVRPGEPAEAELQEALVSAALAEGRARWALLPEPVPSEPPLAKAGGFAGDELVRAVLDRLGFAEVRRFWRMRIDHPAQSPSADSAPGPDGYTVRSFNDTDADWRDLHQVATAAFRDHFDATELAFPAWREHLATDIEDPSQWLLVQSDDPDGGVVGYARGSDRYAEEDFGYVASIGVLREHRGRGLATALLRARFADDARRGRSATLLHVDSTSPTGATRVYEAVGMTADMEIVWYHRPLLD